MEVQGYGEDQPQQVDLQHDGDTDASNTNQQQQLSGSFGNSYLGDLTQGPEWAQKPRGPPRQSNILPLWGNKETMNLNSLILDNIRSSAYFKNNLFALKTYHEVIDEMYYNVGHLEPWEKGSRRMIGAGGSRAMEVRGVSMGGIVSTPYCSLYKLFTLKLTRKQLNGLLNYTDSPFVRALGFMYIRYALHPNKLWEFYEPYLDDEEEIDPKAGGGDQMTIGQMLKLFMTKLDWYSTLFPRIPVPVQKQIEEHMRERNRQKLEEGRLAGARQGADETDQQEQMSGSQSGTGNGDATGVVKAVDRSDQSGGRDAGSHRRSRSRDRSSHHHQQHRDSRSGRSSRERSRHRSRSRGAERGGRKREDENRGGSRDRERYVPSSSSSRRHGSGQRSNDREDRKDGAYYGKEKRRSRSPGDKDRASKDDRSHHKSSSSKKSKHRHRSRSRSSSRSRPTRH